MIGDADGGDNGMTSCYSQTKSLGNGRKIDANWAHTSN